MDPYWVSVFLTDLMKHIGACLSDRDARDLVVSMFRSNQSFHTVLSQLHTADYHELIVVYKEILQRKTGVDLFPPTHTETRLRALETEHANTRAIQANLVDLLREQREYIDAELGKRRA
jgi:hypothetical protein